MERSTEFASAGLAGLAGLQALWAAGSSWPLRDEATLSDAVIGHNQFPSAAACLAVAGALAAGSAFVAGWPAGAPQLQRTGAAVVLAVLSARGWLGLGGLTHLVSPGSRSERFRALDRRVCAPACLALAVLAGPAARRRQPTS